MTRFMIAATLAAMLALTCVPHAEARIFEPQRDWHHSGRICIESRAPAGLDWDGSPPRACVERDAVVAHRQSRTEYAAKDLIWVIALANEERANKGSAKHSVPRLEVFAQPIPGVRR